VLVDPAEADPARRYRMAYYDWSKADDGREHPGLHVAFSPDGIHWTKHPHGPLYKTSYGGRNMQPLYPDEDPLREFPAAGKPPRRMWLYPLTMSDAADAVYDPQRSAYAIYGKMWIDAPDGGGAWKHAMGRTESRDFLTWSQPELLVTPDDHDGPEIEFHTSPVFYHSGCYFCLNQMFQRRLKGAIDIELMTSRDGLRWERNFRDEFFLARSTAGLFDSRSIFTNSTPVVLDDQIRFYYGAYNQSPVGGVKSEPGQRSGVGMASIPRDRFAGIRPVERSEQVTLKMPLEHVGQVTLKPRDLQPVRGISLNADATEGEIRVELLTEGGHRVRQFTRDDAVPLTGDALSHRVAWKDRALADLPAGRYMFRLHLRRATVYAVTLHRD
jgi:hypothetical protein